MKHTGYAVSGWGVGDLWTSEEAVLAHEFRFGDAAAALGPENHPTAHGLECPHVGPRAAPHEGAPSPPTGTVPVVSSRMGHGSVPEARRAHPSTATHVDPDGLVQRFAAFLAGAEVDFADVPLDLEGLTSFQVAVAGSLRAIPRGEVVGYAELAALAGYPGAQRAVGTFCARNRFAFLLPCHRVVGAGGIGGYGSAGVAVKRRLLRLEGVVL